jgi:hypothetical protein
MVSLTDSELDCVMNAARPLDVSARDAFLREGRARWRAAPRSATAWCTGSSPRFSVEIFCRRNLTTEKPAARAAFGWNRRRIRRRGTAPRVS